MKRWWVGVAGAILVFATSPAGAVEWNGRLLLTTNGNESNGTTDGQNRQYIELTTRGPVFLQNRGVLSLILERTTPLAGGPGVLRPLGRIELSGGIYQFQVRYRPSQPVSLDDENSSLRETQVSAALTPPNLPVVRFQSFSGRREEKSQPGKRLLLDRRLDVSHAAGAFRAAAGIRRTRNEETATGNTFRTDQMSLETGFQPRISTEVHVSADAGASRDVSLRQDGRRAENRSVASTIQAGYTQSRKLDFSAQHAFRLVDSRISTTSGSLRSGEQDLLGRVFWKPLVPTSLLLERETRFLIGTGGSPLDAIRFQTVLEGNVMPLVRLRGQYLRTFYLAGGEGSPRDWWSVNGNARVMRGVDLRTDLGLTQGGEAGNQTREQWELRTRPTPIVRLDLIGRVERRGASLGSLSPFLYSGRIEGQYMGAHGPRPSVVWEDRYTPRTRRRDRLVTANIDLWSGAGSSVTLSGTRATGSGGGFPIPEFLTGGVRADMRLKRGAVLSGSYLVSKVTGAPRQQSFTGSLEWRF